MALQLKLQNDIQSTSAIVLLTGLIGWILNLSFQQPIAQWAVEKIKTG